MPYSNSALFFFGSLGVFNGLILSIYFFFFTSKKTLSGYLLGALLFVLSVRIGKSVAFFFNYNLSKIYLQIGLTACFFIGPLLYFFIQAETKQITKIPKSWLLQIGCCFVVIMTVGIIYPYQQVPKLWGYPIIPLIYLQWAIYVGLSVITLAPVIKRLTKKGPVKPHEKWSLFICASVSVILFCYVWAILNFSKGSYINGALWFSIIIYLVVFILMYRKKTTGLFYSSSQKYADKKIDLADAENIMNRLTRIMTEKELFRNPGLKVNDLAKEINISGHQLSQVLNDNVKKNFTLFVNEYRIKEACNMLAQSNNLTIEAIGDEVGFNSKSTFFASFKKIKGTTPSAYQQSITPDL